MKKSIFRGIVLFFGILATNWSLAGAQGENLLANPGFEEVFNQVSGQPPREIAQGWSPWHVAGGRSASENVQPEYYPATDVANGLGVPQIRSGGNAQQFHSFFATHTGGIFQQVNDIVAGSRLRFSIFAYVWSTSFDDVNTSEDDGNVLIRIGIDPAGGRDAESSRIIWSDPVELYDAYNQYVVEAVADASTVTVFVQSTVDFPVKNNNIYLDDASLVVLDAGEAPASPTRVIVNTSTFTAEPQTNTPAPTATFTATATSTATFTATATPVIPTATDNDLGIIDEASPEPTDTAVPPTATPVPPAATAAPVVIVVTATPLPPTATPPPTVTPTDTPVPSPTADIEQVLVEPTVAPTEDVVTEPISQEFPNSIIHTVRAGDTVGELATLYGSSISAIIEANGLTSSAFIQIDQGLIVPVRIGAPATATPTPSLTPSATPEGAEAVADSPTEAASGTTGGTYVVQVGDTLSAIARRFNTTTATLAQLNGIVNPNRIQLGQRLIVPGVQAPAAPPATEGQPQAPQTYIVQPGDGLYRISLRFGTTMGTLIRANNIADPNRIFVGQRLLIP